MERFQNILVGVDLAWGDRLVSDRVGEPSWRAIEIAVGLAQDSGAKICFVYVIDVDAATERMIEEQTASESNVVDQAEKALAKYVELAKECKVNATARVRIGRSWHRLIQDVQNYNHDLAIIGTRDVMPYERVLLGSTAMRMFRRCPCPVVVAKPRGEKIRSVLVAHDMTPVGTLATELAASISELTGAELHVVHALERMEYKDFSTDVARPEIDKISLRIEEELKGQPAIVHLTDDRPEDAIMQAVKNYRIDVVVMGTIARSGIRGFFTGNTAEQLLPQLACTVLAVKPEGFESGIE